MVAAEREREQMKVCQQKCLPIFSFSLAVGWRKKERGRDRREDGRNETKTCSETYREKGVMERDTNEKSAA